MECHKCGLEIGNAKAESFTFPDTTRGTVVFHATCTPPVLREAFHVVPPQYSLAWLTIKNLGRTSKP